MTGCLYDGYYCQAEYQIKFVTPDGRPIDGVQLEVVDKSGNISYGYPVTDYCEGGIPTSDADGVITFHHVQYTMEWGGIFFFCCVLGSGSREFDLLFSRNGELIYDTKYGDLDREVWNDTPTITRRVSVYDADNDAAGEQAWPDSSVNAPDEWGLNNTTQDTLPEGFTFAVMVILSSIALIAGSRYLQKRSKKKEQ